MSQLPTNYDRNAQIRKYIVRVEDRDWTVVPKEDGEYIVQYPEQDKSQVVDLDEHHCTGTYFEYNSTCPHIRACEEVQDQIEDDGQDQIGEMRMSDAVYCEICDKVHAGKCDFQSGGNL